MPNKQPVEIDEKKFSECKVAFLKKLEEQPKLKEEFISILSRNAPNGSEYFDKICYKIQNADFARDLDKNIERLVDEMKVMSERFIRYENVKRQIKEIENISKNPSEIKVKELFDEFERPNRGPVIASPIGLSPKRLEQIASNNTPEYRIEKPKPSEQNNIVDSRDFIKGEIVLSYNQIDAATQGKVLTQAEKEACSPLSWSKEKRRDYFMKDLFEAVSHEAIKIGIPGLTKNNKAEDGKYFKQQRKKHIKALHEASSLRNIGSNSQDGAVYLKYLEGLNLELKNSSDPEDIFLYNSISQFLSIKKEELKKLTKEEEERFEKELNKISKDFYNKSADFTQKEDENFKWQAMMLMFALGPLMPAVAGIGSLNVAAPILKPVMDFILSSQGFATGFSNVIDCLGPFSWIPNQMHIPEAVEFLLNETPFVNSIFGNDGVAQFLLKNDIVQNSLDVVSPLQSSPLPFLFLSAICVTKLASDGFANYIKKGDVSKNNIEAFEGEIRKTVKTKEEILNKSLNGIGGLKSVSEYLLECKKNPFRYGETMRHIAKMSDEQLAQFDDIKLTYGNSGDANETLRSIAQKNGGKLTRDFVGDIFGENNISFNDETYKKIEEKLLLILGFSSEEYKENCNRKLIDKELEKTPSLPKTATEKQLIDHQQKKLQELSYVAPTPSGSPSASKNGVFNFAPAFPVLFGGNQERVN